MTQIQIQVQASARVRLGLVLVTGPLGLVVGWFGVAGCLRVLRAFHEQSSLIVSEPYALVGLFLGLMGLTMAVLFALPPPPVPAGRKEQRALETRTMARTTWFLRFVAGSLVAAGLSSWVQFALVDRAAADRGYVRCPTITWPRHQPDRWVLPDAAGRTSRCPGAGAKRD